MAKWIDFIERPSTGKTRRFSVVSIDALVMLGDIRFYPQWRKFAFFPQPETLFEADFLRDIAQFFEDRTKEWRARL